MFNSSCRKTAHAEFKWIPPATPLIESVAAGIESWQLLGAIGLPFSSNFIPFPMQTKNPKLRDFMAT
jgi:hypothetical protein